ncbi:MAG TPA: VOC family protein [Dongiaceae bacterium]|nr:VOC family protein [Dongiaceae bacterium]
MQMLINIDVPDLRQAQEFYCAAFDLTLGRQLGDEVLELVGGTVPIYLLQKASGSPAVIHKTLTRTYQRHWCPIHTDIVVDDIEAAAIKAVAAGALQEQPIQVFSWGKLALFADPFGHGFCLIQFVGRGYDEISVHSSVM